MKEARYSHQREALFEALQGRTDHPTADTIYRDLRVDNPHISLGTVYRNLNLLSETGRIRKIACADGSDRYDWNMKPHQHFTCKVCSRVIDLDESAADGIKQHLPKEIGTVDELVIAGTCTRCLDAAQNK